MKISLNEVFSNPPHNPFDPKPYQDHVDWKTLTQGRHATALNTGKGIEFFADISGRTPMINFHTNPFKEDQLNSPWRDLIFQESGRVIYNGDNKSKQFQAHEARGNKKILETLPLYFSKERVDRLKAPPIVVTRTVAKGSLTGFREFVGLGLIAKPPKLVHQYQLNSNDVFANFQFEVTLLSLDPSGQVDWHWIDDRRDPSVSADQALSKAPKNWKRWVKDGNSVLDKLQLRIVPYRTVSISEQRTLPPANKALLRQLLEIHYPNPAADSVRFEAMASFITSLYFQEFQYMRGWVTPGTADRGVDFVGRLDVGDDSFSKTSIIVLGQSKRYQNQISGESLTRVASRMTRGYIGVVVTLDTFTVPAQKEIKDDNLPIILINGRKATDLLLNYMNQRRMSLAEIVAEQDTWYERNMREVHYSTILHEE